jgi:hypothetical protein
LHATLQETPKRDYVYLLFNSIKPDRSRQAIEVFLDLLKNLSPQFSEHQKDYEDLYSELKKWPDESVKNFIIENVLQLRPKSPTKDEKSYWTLIDGLTPKAENPTPVKETAV